jgi:hypothetical protein
MDYGLKYPFHDYIAELTAMGKMLGGGFSGGEKKDPKWKYEEGVGFYDENALTKPQAPQGVQTQGKPLTQYQQHQVSRQNSQDTEKKRVQNVKIDSIINRVDEVSKYADSVAEHPGLETATGGWKPNTGIEWLDKTAEEYIPAERIPNKPGSPAANFTAAKNTLKAKIGFAELQAMRQESATGGALGQVAIQEIDWLQNSIESLDAIQDPKEFRKAVKDISERYRKLGGIMREIRTAGGAAPSDASPSGMPTPGMVVDGYVFKGGDPNDPASWEQQ